MGDPAAIDLGVRLLYARYADAVWRRDRAAFVDCFTADAAWRIAGGDHRSHAAIGDAIERFLVGSKRVHLIVGQPLLGITDDGVTGRVSITELVKLADGGGAMTIGTYHDHYADDGDTWRFARHRFALHYRGPPDFSAAMSTGLDFGAFDGATGAGR